jgi:hypothetical protein
VCCHSDPTTLRAIRYRAVLRRWAFRPYLQEAGSVLPRRFADEARASLPGLIGIADPPPEEVFAASAAAPAAQARPAGAGMDVGGHGFVNIGAACHDRQVRLLETQEPPPKDGRGFCRG